MSLTALAVEQASEQLPLWVSIVMTFVVGALGGSVGALIGAASQRKIDRRAARRTAEKALWNLQRVLHDYAVEMEEREIRTGDPLITHTTSELLANARAEAYPYRRHLSTEAQKLLTRNWMPEWTQTGGYMAVSDDFSVWAEELEAEIVRVFGKDDS